MEHWPLYVVIGFAGGVLGAALGVGGGIIYVPALVLLFGFAQREAQGISLLALACTGIAGVILYSTIGNMRFDLKAGVLVGLGSVLGTVAGTAIAAHTPTHILRRAFALLLTVVAIKLFMTKSPPRAAADAEPPPTTGHDGQNR